MFSERKFGSSLSLLLGFRRLLGLVLDGRLRVPLGDGVHTGAGAVGGLEGGHLAQHPRVHARRRQQRSVVQGCAGLVLGLKLIIININN